MFRDFCRPCPLPTPLCNAPLLFDLESQNQYTLSVFSWCHSPTCWHHSLMLGALQNFSQVEGKNLGFKALDLKRNLLSLPPAQLHHERKDILHTITCKLDPLVLTVYFTYVVVGNCKKWIVLFVVYFDQPTMFRTPFAGQNQFLMLKQLLRPKEC